MNKQVHTNQMDLKAANEGKIFELQSVPLQKFSIQTENWL